MVATPLVFPDRPLTVRPPGYSIWPPIGWLAASVVMVFGSWLVLTAPIPDLRNDWAIRKTAQEIPQAEIADGRCKSRLVLVECQATLISTLPTGAEVRHTTRQYFVDFHLGDYSVTVMGDPARSAYLTTDLALSKFWNRVVTLALSVPLFGAIVSLMALAAIRRLRDRRSILGALNRRPLRPVALLLGGMNHQVWRVGHTHGDGSTVWEDWNVFRRAPIVIDQARGLVLGVTAGDGRVSMPLDERLSWIGLTDAERHALRRSLEPILH